MADVLSPEAFQDETGVSRETLERLQRHAALLRKWTAHINLVSRRSLADLWRRHMLDSAQLMPLLPPPPGDRPRVLLDMGSGAGFPGLVLAIMGAGHVHLVEADQRKAAFLREAVRLTAATATVHGCRIERLDPFPADVITARALAPLAALIAHAERFSTPQTRHIYQKSAGFESEVDAARRQWNFSVESVPSCTYCTSRILVIGVAGRATTTY